MLGVLVWNGGRTTSWSEMVWFIPKPGKDTNGIPTRQSQKQTAWMAIVRVHDTTLPRDSIKKPRGSRAKELTKAFVGVILIFKHVLYKT